MSVCEWIPAAVIIVPVSLVPFFLSRDMGTFNDRPLHAGG